MEKSREEVKLRGEEAEGERVRGGQDERRTGERRGCREEEEETGGLRRR